MFEENSSKQQCEKEDDQENDNLDSDVEFLHSEDRNKTIPFKCIDNNWQAEKAALFGLEVKNYHNQNKPYQEVSVHAEPTKTIAMRGDGNCLFRAFSYILFGVQSYHVLVRDYIVGFMKNRKDLFERVEATPIGSYIAESHMSEVGTWGTELEILAFATMLNTTIYVYCPQGKKDGKQIYGQPF